jgi:predicted transcriptional regulator
LPKERKQKVLRAIFGSQAPIDIFSFSLKQGISKKIYQKDLIRKLDYSNKTILEHLKTFSESGILDEQMEKMKSGTRTVWVKSFNLTDLGKWFALLLVEEKNLTKKEKAEIVRNAFQSYIIWIRELYEKLGMDKKDLAKIFKEKTT